MILDASEVINYMKQIHYLGKLESDGEVAKYQRLIIHCPRLFIYTLFSAWIQEAFFAISDTVTFICVQD